MPIFSLPGYNHLEFKLRGNNVQGGGVGIFVKNNCKYTVLSAHSLFVDRIFETIFIKLELPNSRKCIIGSIYRPGANHPTLSTADLYENFTELLSNTLNEISSLNTPVYILGYLNLEVLQYESCKQSSEYINLLFAYGFLQVVTKPTRCTTHSATIIDHVLTNASHPSFETAIITSRISDHFPIVFFLQPKKPTFKPKTIVSRDFSRQNLDKFNAALHNVRWGFVQEEDDPQIAYTLFSDTFLNLYNLHFPLREIRFNKNHHTIEPWMSKGLLISRSRKHELASLSAKNPTPNSILIFKAYRNLYNKTLRAGKKLYYESE
jgi:hypothetical protein